MAVENNTILTTDLARVREVDFVTQFNGSIAKLIEALGITRKLEVQEGVALKQLKVVGTLASGPVAEGEIIPLSKYETEEVSVGEIKLNKWRKGTTAEAIVKGGYDQAVGATTDKMVKDIQKTIRSDMFAYLANGTGSASGASLQAALAASWGQMQILWEDDAVDLVHFVNPLDVASYLASAQITTQNAFGMTYVKDFLGLGMVILNSSVPQGKFYSTAVENLIVYFVNVSNSKLAQAFDLTTDETGYIGISEYPDKDSARVMDLALSGVTFFAERVDGIVVGTIAGG